MSGLFKRALVEGGCKVYSTEAFRQRGPSGVSPGIADLIVLVPGGFGIWFVEVKTWAGRQTPAQARFAADVRDAGGRYELWRELDDCKRWLRNHGPAAYHDSSAVKKEAD